VNELFRRFAHKTSEVVGTPWMFLAAVIVVLVWAVSGPVFGFSDTWQLVINTGTTIGTFLIVFLIQNTQNRDAKAIHLKLDELIRAVGDARNSLVDVEDESEGELERLQNEFKQIRGASGANPEAERGGDQPPAPAVHSERTAQLRESMLAPRWSPRRAPGRRRP
jgi:low affinity Fe/Cu permease